MFLTKIERGLMMVKQIFEEKDRQLLLRSRFLLDNADTTKIYNIIKKKNFFDSFENLTTEIQNQIKVEYEIWLAQCRKEWKAVAAKPKTDIRHKKNKPRCDLCNQPLRTTVCHIINQKTKKTLDIGVQCFDKMTTKEGQLYLNFTDEEAHNFIRFQKKCPLLNEFLNEPSLLNYPDQTEYIMPDSIYKKEANLRQKLSKKINFFCKGKAKIDDFNRLNTDLIMLKNNVAKYNNQSYTMTLLSKQQYKFLKISYPDRLQRIVILVKQNYGKINTNAASLILEPTFLEGYCKIVNEQLKNRRSKMFISYSKGKFHFNYEISDMYFTISCPTSTIIEYTHFPKIRINLQELVYIISKSMQEVTPFSNLLQLSILALKKMGLNIYKLNTGILQKYINEQEKDMSVGRTIIQQSKLTELMKINYIFTNNNGDFFLTSVDLIKDLGKKILRNELTQSVDLQNVDMKIFTKVDKKELLKKIYDLYVLKFDNIIHS